MCMLGTPITVFAILRAFPNLDKVFMSADFHLVIASSIAACAIGIAIIAGLAAGRSRDYALIFLAIGCLGVGVLMLGHGLTTPGVAGVQPNQWVSRFPSLAIAAFALSQLLAVMRPRRGLERAVTRHPWVSMAVPTVLLCGALALAVSSTRQIPTSTAPSGDASSASEAASSYGASSARESSYGNASYGESTDESSAGSHDSHGSYGSYGGGDATSAYGGSSYAEPGAGSGAPSDDAAPAPQGDPTNEKLVMNAIAIISAAILMGVGLIHWRRWRLSSDGVVLALALACWLAVEALVSLRFGSMWHVSWWDYHALLLLGFGSSVFAIVSSYLRKKERSSLSGAFLHDSLDHIARGYPEALKTLVAAVEARDEYTSGHSRRVTETAAAIGQRIGLHHDDLRRLVWGAELHDIGKIGISDHIIHKPGRIDRRGTRSRPRASGYRMGHREASKLAERGSRGHTPPSRTYGWRRVPRPVGRRSDPPVGAYRCDRRCLGRADFQPSLPTGLRDPQGARDHARGPRDAVRFQVPGRVLRIHRCRGPKSR